VAAESELFLVMEFVDGTTLLAHFDALGPGEGA
jgi:hypothetical protein